MGFQQFENEKTEDKNISKLQLISMNEHSITIISLFNALITNDNIKIPDYIIELYKYLIKTHLVSRTGNVACRLEKMEMFFEMVKNLKKSIKNI